ncbi:MAG: serine hydrolase, partial [Collinsella sp.]
LIEAAVVNSDNDSFIALRAAFDRVGYEDWIAALGVEDEVALDPMSDFPTYCPRTSAKLWREMSEYLSCGSEASQWLSELLSSTSRSFIRDGIADEQVLVRNKAGWISEDGCYSTCDAGLIDIDGRTYVMSIMTSMPWSDRSSEVTAAIARLCLIRELRWLACSFDEVKQNAGTIPWLRISYRFGEWHGYHRDYRCTRKRDHAD